MSETESIRKAGKTPVTVTSLIRDFEKIGIKPGMTILVHSSLSSLGWVCGGPVAVILALEQVLGENGTLVMPTHSSDLTDPQYSGNPPVPESWWEIIRAEMPAFDPDVTPTREMGVISETFRKQKDVVRSTHPISSFAAWGKNREFIIQDNHWDFSQNEKSPLGRVYELDGFVLLLGVDYMNNTSFHLAEYKADYPSKKNVTNGCPILANGKRKWISVTDILYDSDDFMNIGLDYEKNHDINECYIGQAKSKLIPQRSLVDFAKTWMEKNRR